RAESKKSCGHELVQTYQWPACADKTLADWNGRFSEKRLDAAGMPSLEAMSDEAVTIVVTAYAQAFGINKSRADASRLIKQGSVQIDGKKIVDPKEKASLRTGQVLRLDKTRAVRIK